MQLKQLVVFNFLNNIMLIVYLFHVINIKDNKLLCLHQMNFIKHILVNII